MATPDLIEKLIPLDSPDEWNEALNGIPHSFTHTREHCYAMQLTTGYATYLYVVTSGDTRIVCPIAERSAGEYLEAITPWGFSGFAGNGELADFPSIWEAFLRSRGYVTAYITLNPMFCRPTFADAQLTCSRNTLHLIDLLPSEEEILDGFSRARRRGLRSWSRSGVTIVEDRDTLTDFFLKHHHGTVQRMNMPPAFDFAESTLAYLLSLDTVYMVGAKTPSGLQTALIGCATPYVADGLLSVSLPDSRGHMAGLIWHAAKHFRQQGIPFYNLGGELASRDGVAGFKRQFGTREMPLRSLRQIVRPAIYNELCTAAGCDAGSDGYFPPYQRKAAEGNLRVHQIGEILR